MAFSRLDLVKRLITETSAPNGAFVSDSGQDPENVFGKRVWTDLNSFVNVCMSFIR